MLAKLAGLKYLQLAIIAAVLRQLTLGPPGLVRPAASITSRRLALAEGQ